MAASETSLNSYRCREVVLEPQAQSLPGIIASLQFGSMHNIARPIIWVLGALWVKSGKLKYEMGNVQRHK